MVEEETGLLCATDDLAGLTSQILKLLENPSLAQEMGTRGRIRVQRDFRWEVSVPRLRDDLLGTPSESE